MKRRLEWRSVEADDAVDLDDGVDVAEAHAWGVLPWGNFHWGDDLSAGDGRRVRLMDARAAAPVLLSLDDSVLLGILSFLDARSLARLGQTCRALAVFCHHEPLWKDLLVATCGGEWSFCGGSFRNTLVLTRFGGPPCRPIRVAGLYSDLLNKSWVCASARFSRSWVGIDTVPRERPDELTVADFVRRYEAPNVPVLLSGAARHWPIFRELEAWTASRSGTRFKVGPTSMTLGNFLEYSREALDEDPLYLFDKHFADKCPELVDMYSVPPYFAGRDLFGLLGEDERPDYRWLIAGGPCSGSTFHIDPNGTSAWNAALSGAKKWILAPRSAVLPGVVPSASFGEVATTLSAVEWFVDFYQHLKDAEVPGVLECIQRPGDIIFVPHGWFHVVLNLETSFALTHNYVSTVNLRAVMRFLDERPDQVSGVSEDRKHDLGRKFRAALGQSAPSALAELEAAERLAREPSAWDKAKAGGGFSLFATE